MRSPDIFQRIKENQFTLLCDFHPANIGQEATALNHKSPFTPFSSGVSLLTGMSAFILGSQETSDDPSPSQHQHLFIILVFLLPEPAQSPQTLSNMVLEDFVDVAFSSCSKSGGFAVRPLLSSPFDPNKGLVPTTQSDPWRKAKNHPMVPCQAAELLLLHITSVSFKPGHLKL